MLIPLSQLQVRPITLLAAELECSYADAEVLDAARSLIDLHIASMEGDNATPQGAPEAENQGSKSVS
jgi:hypothetical protein